MLTVPCRVLDSIKGDIGRRVGRQDVTLAKKGGAARGKKKWLVTALFSNREVDRYLFCTGSGYVWSWEGDPGVCIESHSPPTSDDDHFDWL